jgi:homoserine O-acetyltransferase/O-succinyltransferase
MSELKSFKFSSPFQLESGALIYGLELAYSTYGALDQTHSNVVWIFHALTANNKPFEWWEGLAGPYKLFNPEEHFIVCVNMPGSCYGSSSPLSLNPQTSMPYYHDFPYFTIRDMVRAFSVLKDELGIISISLAIGGSMGGMQALEWAIEEPTLIDRLVLLATNAQHSPWGIAFNAAQRLAIESDATWKEKSDKAGSSGLLAARSIALLSYRNYRTYQLFQQDERDLPEMFRAETYQLYQGKKLVGRFNAFSYFALSKGMDSHNVGRNRGGLQKALNQITSKTCIIGIETDLLFPVSEQYFLAEHITNSEIYEIKSEYGHDGFLLEYEQLESLLRSFLEKSSNQTTNKNSKELNSFN